MNEVMVDFETLATDPDCVVISIGAAFFDIETQKIGPTFYANFEIDSQLKKGRQISADTLKWWMGQDGAAKKVFSEQAADTQMALQKLDKWIRDNSPNRNKLTVWGNGSTFDVSIIEDLFRNYEIAIPWRYYNVYDLRTFKRFVAKGAKVEVDGTKHNALDDALAQARYVLSHSRPEDKNAPKQEAPVIPAVRS